MQKVFNFLVVLTVFGHVVASDSQCTKRRQQERKFARLEKEAKLGNFDGRTKRAQQASLDEVAGKRNRYDRRK